MALGMLWVPTALAEEWPAADWTRGEAPASPEALKAFEAFTFPPQRNTTRAGVRTNAIVVISDGKLIYERYMGETRAETPHLTWSVSKSLMATVLGVA
jgi:CubicO group peptidase (beta-lactamase class C family)